MAKSNTKNFICRVQQSGCPSTAPKQLWMPSTPFFFRQELVFFQTHKLLFCSAVTTATCTGPTKEYARRRTSQGTVNPSSYQQQFLQTGKLKVSEVTVDKSGLYHLSFLMDTQGFTALFYENFLW